MAVPARLGLRLCVECSCLFSAPAVALGCSYGRSFTLGCCPGRSVRLCSASTAMAALSSWSRGGVRNPSRELWRGRCCVAACVEEQDSVAVTGEERKASLLVVSFYKFADVPDYEALREPIRELCNAKRVSGHIILAAEGINGSICGTPEAVQDVLTTVQLDARFDGMRMVEAPAGAEDELIHHGHTARSPLGAGDDAPFRWDHVRVKLKKEVVPLGVPGVNPVERVGKYVKPRDWNALIKDPQTLLVDVRNDYEVRIGRFKGALDPRTTAFRDFPAWVSDHLRPGPGKNGEQHESKAAEVQQQPSRVALYCTGGIRCEKASSFLLNQGFQEVCQLEGGILKYLDEVPPSESMWEGECFVFDKRVSVEHGQKQGSYRLCYACKKPVNAEDEQSALWEEGVSCPHCCHLKSQAEKERARARQLQSNRWGKVGGPDNRRRHPSPNKNRKDDEHKYFFSRCG